MPNFVIAGSAKSGTTALHYMLDRHPDVHMSEVKETNYFVHGFEQTLTLVDLKGRPMFAGVADDDLIRTPDQYAGLFRADARCNGEASPWYLLNPRVPERLVQHRADMKVVVMLRNPSDVAFANYLHQLRVDAEPLPMSSVEQILCETRYEQCNLHPFCRHLDIPHYARHLPPWTRLFGEAQLHVVVYEEFRADPDAELQRLFRFLGVNDDVTVSPRQQVNKSGLPRSAALNQLIYRDNPLKRLVAALVPKKARRKARSRLESWNTSAKPELPHEVRAALDARYTADVDYVEALLGRRIDAWHERRLA